MNLQLTKFSLSFMMLLLITAGAFAQVREVTGQVTDTEGKPIEGVTVTIKGTAGNVITDANGKYKVMATPEETIVFTHVSFVIKEVKVANHPSVNVTLSHEDSKMDEIIVIGYGTQRQKNVTGSVVSVNTEKLADMPVATVTEALRGQVPGLNVSGGSQRPGVMPSLSIRQQFNWGKDGGNTNPLIIIDDVIQLDPQSGLSTMDRFNLLDLSEVESITVLRDAAAAIYGFRASQGAIVVKTKRGKIGVPRINYAGKFETNNAVSHGKVMNAHEYGVYANRFGRAAGWDAKYFFSTSELERMKSLNYDWLDDWKAANAMQHSLTVSGGSERATFFTGGSYYTQGANLGSQDYNRYTFRAGTDVTVLSGLKLSATISANNFNQEKSFTKINVQDGSYAIGGEQNDYSVLLHTPKYIPYKYNIGGVDRFVSPALGPNKLGTVSSSTLAGVNYYALLDNGSKSVTKSFGYNANFSLAYEMPFIRGLSFKVNYAIQSSSSNTEADLFQSTLSRANNTNTAEHHLYDSATWDNPAVSKNNSRVTYDNTTSSTEQINFFVNYERNFGHHNISAVFSGEREKNTFDERYQIYENPVIGAYNGTSVSAGTLNSGNTYTSRYESGTLSYLGRVSYNYKSRYLFQFLFRADANSKFAPENYWGFFPTASAGWVISDENWFASMVPWMNFLKLRGSIGITGNDNVKPWKWMQLYKAESGSGMSFGSNGGTITTGLTPEVSPNRDIKWDRTVQRNIGIDFSMLRNRLSVNLDQYINNTSDMLTVMTGAVGVPVSVGGAFAEQNYSGVKAWGTEITVTWKDRIANKVDYAVSMNFGIGNNRITKYIDQAYAYPSQTTTRKEAGQSTFTPAWGYRTWKQTSGGDGMLRTDADIDAYWAYLTDNAAKSGVAGAAPNFLGITNKALMKKGMLVYEDVAGNLDATNKAIAGPNGTIATNQDYAMLKKDTRSYSIATNLNFSYKGISLQAQIITSWGGLNKLDYLKQATSSTSMMWAQPVFMNDMYDSTDNPNGKYPNLYYYDSFGGTSSDFFTIHNFRMYVRSLSVGYAFPKKWISKARLENARVYLTGNNLWDFYNPYPDHYRNMYDQSNTGYPTLRTWALGVNLGF